MTKKNPLVWAPEKYHGLIREFESARGIKPAVNLVGNPKIARIIFGQPAIDSLADTPDLQWIHLASAGYEKYDTPEFRLMLQNRRIIMTNSSGVYDEPCAQHLLSMMLALARRLPDAFASQHNDRSWPMNELRAGSTLLNGQTAMIFGYGAIARRLIELLAPLHMNLIGVRRKITSLEPIRMITESEVDDCLETADHIVNILPANPSTRGYFHAGRFAKIRTGSIFYNIGRGVTVDQDALLEALETGRLAASFLDVTDPEPLPPGHPLWRAPNCLITPHTAGGHRNEQERLVNHFLDNLKRFEQGEPLLNRILA